jgi:broad specificity phosphatase PhoE
MALLRYLTHPQVVVDPHKPVPQWGLSEVGHSRVAALAASGRLQGTGRIVSSAETKAVETAQPLAGALGLALEIEELSHENDRSATGFLPPAVFEQVADEFFANPLQSVRGWEKAIDAQNRIVAVASKILAAPSQGDVLMVGHGGVGTLLFCYLSRMPIQRLHDQPAGGGNLWAYDMAAKRMCQHWQPIEAWMISGV